jgi:hypothetical protein
MRLLSATLIGLSLFAGTHVAGGVTDVAPWAACCRRPMVRGRKGVDFGLSFVARDRR